MDKKETKQAIQGFTEMFKAITGNQDLKIPNEIEEKYEMEEQTGWKKARVNTGTSEYKIQYARILTDTDGNEIIDKYTEEPLSD